MSNPSKLKVIIVGSGLAGLAAARILREHHHVTVFERGDASISTGGQGIIIASNGVKILETIGYDRNRAGAVPILGIRTYDKEGNVLEDADMDLKTRFGADCLAQKRSDFRDELLRLATAPSAELGIEGEPAKMMFSTPVVDLNCEEGTVTFADRSTDRADVIIIADGVHSRLRNIVLKSNEYVAKKVGLICYRIAVSIEDAKKALGDLPLPHWWEPSTCQNRSSLLMSNDGTFRVATCYPLRNQTYFNISCIIKTKDPDRQATESWYADGDQGKMIEEFSDFGESFRRILSAATEVKLWELQDLSSLPTWVRGRTILIGDAAHAMTPMQGQGANMCMEDADSLRLLIPGTKREEVPDILKVIEGFRRPRVARILEETRKAHTTLGLAERVMRNAEFIYGYSGIFEAVREREGGKGV